MFWNDIIEIKEWMNRLTDRLVRIDHNVEKLRGLTEQECGAPSVEAKLDVIQDLITDGFYPEEESAPINRINDKLNSLIDDANRQQAVLLAEKTLDKFDDYMKNVEKLNALINEFKGCVSLARGALEDRKKASEQEAKNGVLVDINKEIYKSMMAFIQAGDKLESKAHYKMDAIYRAVCENQEKKSPKKRKRTKKKAVSEAPASE